MYAAVVALTMFVAPLASIAFAFGTGQSDWIWLAGKWFVFWGVGVRLLLAGLRQYFQPAFTSRDILGVESPDAYVLVRELGGANVASAAVALSSLAAPTFVLPSAIGAAIFFGVAGYEHARGARHGVNETIAMVSDIFIAVVLAAFAVAALARGLR